MYFIGEIPHPACKISLYRWNNKYFVKFETATLEQTFKIPETDVSGEAEVREIIAPALIEGVVERFEQMNHALMTLI